MDEGFRGLGAVCELYEVRLALLLKHRHYCTELAKMFAELELPGPRGKPKTLVLRPFKKSILESVTNKS